MKTKYATSLRISRLRFAVLVFFAFFSMMSWGQIAAWQFGTPATVGDETTYNPTTTNSNLTVSALSRGAGITAVAYDRAFSSIYWNATSEATAVSLNEYYQFSIQVNPGTNRFVSLSALDAILRRSTNGPQKFIWKYNVTGDTWISIGTYKSSTDNSVEGVIQSTIDLSTISDLQNVQAGKTITFRLYAWEAPNPSTGIFVIGRTPASTSTNALSISGVAGIRVNPVITTDSITDMLTSTAIGHGTITTVGYPLPTESGVFVSTTNSTPTISTPKFNCDTTITGAFKAYLTNLTPNKTYYATAFVTNDINTYYGKTVSFKSSSLTPSAISNAGTNKFSFTHNVLAATYYRGKNYTLYTKDTQDNLNLGSLTIVNNGTNLVIDSDDAVDVSGEGYSSKYTSGSLLVINDTLYAFARQSYNRIEITAYKTNTKNELIKLKNVNGYDFCDYLGFTAPDIPDGNHITPTNIATVMFNNQPYMLVQNSSTDNKLYLIKGTKYKWNSLFIDWTYVDTVKDENGNPIHISSTNDDTFDLTTIRCADGNDSLVVGRSTKNKITLYLYREGKNWKTYERPVSQDISSCFKMIQGAFAGTGAIEEKNTLQCIGKNNSYTYTEVFDIDGRKFVGENQLTQRDGSFATCAAVVGEPVDYMYQQYITLITGDLTNQTDADTYKSNKIIMKQEYANTDVILKNKSLRGLATLVGIVEGPPPSALETEAEYDISSALGKESPATLQKIASETTSATTTTTFTGGGEVGVSFGVVSASVSYKRESERSVEKKLQVTDNTTFGSKHITERDNAILCYEVPTLSFNKFFLCTPSSVGYTGGNYKIVAPNPIMTDISIASIGTDIVYVPLTSPPFNVTNPRSLDSWRAENRFINSQNGSDNNTLSGYASYNFIGGLVQNKSFLSSSTTITNKSNEVSVSVEAKFFNVLNIKATASYKLSKSKLSTFSDQLQLAMESYRNTNNIGNRYNSFLTTFDMWTVENNSVIAEHYYSALRNKDSLCLKSETPWIITYRVSKIVNGTTTNLAETKSSTDNFSLKLYRQGESSVSLDINSLSNDMITVELYSLSGQKVQTLFNQRSIATGTSTLTTDCNVPTGIYIVKSHTSNGYKSSLVRL